MSAKKKKHAHFSKEEIQSARHESAATLAIDKSRQHRHSLFPFLKLKLTVRILTIVLILLFISGLGIFTYTNLFAGTTYKSESFSMVESVQDLATLATAEAFVTTIIKEEDHKLFNKDINVNLPGTKRTLLLIVPATVLAGVDLQLVSAENMEINEETKEISITIPHAQLIQEPSIQMDKVQTYSEEGLFRSEVHWDEGFDLAVKAKEQIEHEAIELGILSKAEESAVQVLSSFFEHLGYRSTISFE
ncbi:DUF4230 domain-containing protein [Mesobacillus maritimus]|uniref:DUF4230 domain-containing protein n=1 Tax=Mesobacillus maritimus TaxID=1643336 RepID=A0ABS7K5H6_9BACI|nr:DUF4230 domain-containing protein [Mesobacillus maritimus]MBY0097511.1 DUF4230 domain-containing protein [Mesobacillus maritimus]